jgi:hypothetical protein
MGGIGMSKKAFIVFFLIGILGQPAVSLSCGNNQMVNDGVVGIVSDILMTPFYIVSELLGTGGTQCNVQGVCPCCSQPVKKSGKVVCVPVQTCYCQLKNAYVVCVPVSTRTVVTNVKPIPVTTVISTSPNREIPKPEPMKETRVEEKPPVIQPVPQPEARATVPPEPALPAKVEIPSVQIPPVEKPVVAPSEVAKIPESKPVPVTAPEPTARENIEIKRVQIPEEPPLSRQVEKIVPSPVEKPIAVPEAAKMPEPKPVLEVKPPQPVEKPAQVEDKPPVPENKPVQVEKPVRKKTVPAPCGVYYSPPACAPRPPVCR